MNTQRLVSEPYLQLYNQYFTLNTLAATGMKFYLAAKGTLPLLSRNMDDYDPVLTSLHLAYLDLLETQDRSAFVGIMDAYRHFLSSVLFAVLKADNRMLKSLGKSYTVNQVMQFETLEDFLEAVAEEYVHALAYKSFAEFVATMKKDFNIEIMTPQEVEEVVYYIELRNIFVHNNGVVNKVFLKKVGSRGEVHKVGDRAVVPTEAISRLYEVVLKSAERLDGTMVKKYTLPTVPFEPLVGQEAQERMEQLHHQMFVAMPQNTTE